MSGRPGDTLEGIGVLCGGGANAGLVSSGINWVNNGWSRSNNDTISGYFSVTLNVTPL